MDQRTSTFRQQARFGAGRQLRHVVSLRSLRSHFRDRPELLVVGNAAHRAVAAGLADAPARIFALEMSFYGIAVPDCALTTEMSELLISPFTVTSSRKLESTTAAPLCPLV